MASNSSRLCGSDFSDQIRGSSSRIRSLLRIPSGLQPTTAREGLRFVKLRRTCIVTRQFSRNFEFCANEILGSHWFSSRELLIEFVSNLLVVAKSHLSRTDALISLLCVIWQSERGSFATGFLKRRLPSFLHSRIQYQMHTLIIFNEYLHRAVRDSQSLIDSDSKELSSLDR
jgi:hypothetical protein